MAGLIERAATVSATLTQGTGQYQDGVEITEEFYCNVFQIENSTQKFTNDSNIQSGTAFLVAPLSFKPKLPATLEVEGVLYNVSSISTYRNLKGVILGYQFIVANG